MKNKKNTKGSKSRRDFIKTTAATTAGIFLGSQAVVQSTASAQEATQTKADEKPKEFPADRRDEVRLGIIGCGGMGAAHMVSFLNMRDKKIDNVAMPAICDVNQRRLESNLGSTSERQGFKVRGYADYRKLLESKDIDAVLIATPEHWHAQMAIDALSAGKDVYVEKPMTLRLDDALRLYRFAQGRKEKLMVGTQYLTYQKYHDARKLIADGGIGHPTFSQTSYCRNSVDGEWLYGIDKELKPGVNLDWDAWCGPLGPAAWDTEVYHRWRRYSKWSTGIMGDLLVHMMTPLLYALDAGWPVRVVATGGHYVDKAMDNHDQVNITAQFEKEHTMIVAGSTCNQYGLEEMIRGHEANLFLSGGQAVLRPEPHFVEEIDEQRFQYEGMDPHNAIRHDFFQCVRTRKEPISPVEWATKIMVIVDLATRSMWKGKAYSFDPETMTARAI